VGILSPYSSLFLASLLFVAPCGKSVGTAQ
jgi:hypothetical protein